jgi:hypothetical protein
LWLNSFVQFTVFVCESYVGVGEHTLLVQVKA